MLLLLIYVFQRISRQREEAQRHLIKAINSLNDAFVMFDANNRLVQCNRRYRELYNLPDGAVRAGTPRQDVIRAILERNSIADAEGKEAQWLARRLRETRLPFSETLRHLSDGRRLRVTDVRMPDGFSVGLHTDITDLEKRAPARRRGQPGQIGVPEHGQPRVENASDLDQGRAGAGAERQAGHARRSAAPPCPDRL
ncbi:PAS-domain containing protein [Jhaorihella thermophila]